MAATYIKGIMITPSSLDSKTVTLQDGSGSFQLSHGEEKKLTQSFAENGRNVAQRRTSRQSLVSFQRRIRRA